MLQPTRDKCDFCDEKAYTRTFAGDHLCKAHAGSWLEAMQWPRLPEQSLANLWHDWAEWQKHFAPHAVYYVPDSSVLTENKK